MPFLTIFKSAFVTQLTAAILANLPKYLGNDRWVQEIGTRSSRDIDTRVEMKTPLALEEPDRDNLKDLENAILVHKALKHLTPLQARDPRLWTRMAHVDAYQYMRKRWELERSGSDEGKGARFIAARYFVTQNEGRALLRNGIARLWWTSYLTYDAARNNPYELTAVLLSTLDITQQILERNMGRAPGVVTGFLEFLLQNRDLLLTGGDQNRERIRRLAKFLNMYGGVCLLDCLKQTDIIKLLSTELERVLASEANKKAKKVARA